MKRNLRVIISGGGTGGHIFPAVSIANAIKELLIQIFCLSEQKEEWKCNAFPQLVIELSDYLLQALTVHTYSITYLFYTNWLKAR